MLQLENIKYLKFDLTFKVRTVLYVHSDFIGETTPSYRESVDLEREKSMGSMDLPGEMQRKCTCTSPLSSCVCKIRSTATPYIHTSCKS